ncbi:MAG: hypothetical protein QOJ29_3075 [Thermoleophilaceae bacterium]|nr:hypothetical protein [Thermoleophilaceae bacterium]
MLSVIAGIAARNGGPGVNVVDSVPHLARAGVELTIATTDAAEPASARSLGRLTDADFPEGADKSRILVYPLGRLRRIGFSAPLYRGVRAKVADYDVVRVHGVYLFSQFAAAHLARRNGIPYVVSPHGMLDPYLREKGRPQKLVMDLLWQRRALERANAIHVMTAEEGRLISDIAPDVPRRVVPNGIDTSRFSAIRTGGEKFRARHLDGHEGPLLVFLSRISHKKGLDLLIRAFARCSGDVPDARLAIVGPDDEVLTPNLEQLARECGVERRIAFTGPLFGEERDQALAAADAWVLPSYTENFGIAVAEALASGLPVVISTAVNIAPDARDANAALVCDLDPEAFAEAIRKVLTDAALRQELGDRARSFARRYDWSVVAPAMRALFEEIADLGRVPARA